MMPNDKPLRGLLSALSDRARPRRTALHEWLRRNHTAITSMFAAQGVNWLEFTNVLIERGMTDRTGKPVAIHTVKSAWYRVCAEMAAKPAPVSTRPARKAFAARQPPARPRPVAADKLSPPPAADSDPLAELRARMNQRFGRTPE